VLLWRRQSSAVAGVAGTPGRWWVAARLGGRSVVLWSLLRFRYVSHRRF
jgi:hypothetical protein